jgi:hypothetical protein
LVTFACKTTSSGQKLKNVDFEGLCILQFLVSFNIWFSDFVKVFQKFGALISSIVLLININLLIVDVIDNFKKLQDKVLLIWPLDKPRPYQMFLHLK